MDIFQTVHGKKGGLTSWQVMLLPRKAEGESGGPKVKVKVYYLPVSRSEASEASRVCKSDLCGVEDRCEIAESAFENAPVIGKKIVSYNLSIVSVFFFLGGGEFLTPPRALHLLQATFHHFSLFPSLDTFICTQSDRQTSLTENQPWH